MTDTSENRSFEDRLNEAGAYQSHGLLNEALEIYREILHSQDEPDARTRKDVEDRISELETLINELDHDDNGSISDGDIDIIKKSWDESISREEIMDSAASFMELGMLKDAITEYERLFHTELDPGEFIPEYVKCIVKHESITNVVRFLKKRAQENDLPDSVKAALFYHGGLRLEKFKQVEQAVTLYGMCLDIDPDYEDAAGRVDNLESALSYDSRYGWLLENGIVTADQLQAALSMSKKMSKSVEFVLMENYNIDKEDIGKSLHYFYQCPFVEFDTQMQVPYELIKNLKKAFLLRNTWVPLDWDLDRVNVLIDDPSDFMRTDQIPTLLNTNNISFKVGIKEDIDAVIQYFYSTKSVDDDIDDAHMDEDFAMMPDIEFEEDEDEVIEEISESSSQIVKMVDQILVSAYRKGASDIHIEPSPAKKKTSVRYRIDGVCQEVLQVPNSNAKGLISRLKIMSNLDIAERRLPQDGKIKFKRKGIKPFELRLATLPTAGGYEDAVLRILAESGSLKLDDLKLSERNRDVLKRIISQPYGLVLVVGPTGSGKTTTLHSALGYINKPGVKIWTAEDPVEITQEGLRQVECNSKIGLDFPRIMRAFLRADPDVIMIGEMRDNETASIGIEASLTGHLVFSTLHTNSAPETVTRLLDMGLNPLNFSDAFLGVLAQRLVRRLCDKCKKSYHPSEEEFNDIVSLYGDRAFSSTGIEYSKDFTLYKAVGCEACSGSGYKGRMGIHELMDGTKRIKNLIKISAPTEELFEVGAEEGMTTLVQDGILKVFEGLTDLVEVRRVCVV